jgi:Ni,Fe-hydrogenase III small subunit
MGKWLYDGLRTGVKTTRYPRQADDTPGVTPGLPLGRLLSNEDRGEVAERCPTGALVRGEGLLSVDYHRCVHCFRCVRGPEDRLRWRGGVEWARIATPTDGVGRAPLTAVSDRETGWRPLGTAFTKSIHVRVVDAGDCGACLREVKQLSNPYYNLHRLGFFFTPTPRQADVLLVVGAGTAQMRTALEKTYAAMPTPCRVLAVGACALSGGIFRSSSIGSNGVAAIVPVDVEVPGNPPPPLAILHGLLLVTGRAREFSPESDPS